MSVETVERPARMRRSRTRTKNVSAREALVLSTLGPHQYDLRPACASLICPDCKTWCPITGVQAKVQKIVPHHAGVADEDEAIRCAGSNRRVIVDVKFEVWWRHLEDGVAQTDGRRATRVLRKPKAPLAPAVTQIPARLTACGEQAEQREHGSWLLREIKWASTADAVRRADIQRVHDALEATLRQRSEQLTEWERADLTSAIEMLEARVKQLRRP